jgi:hypothetical protein
MLSLALLILAGCGGNSGDDATSRFSRLALRITTDDQSLHRRLPSQASVLLPRQVPGDFDFITTIRVTVIAGDSGTRIMQTFSLTADDQEGATVEFRVPRGNDREIIAVAFNEDNVAIFDHANDPITVNLTQDVVQVTITLTPLFPIVINPGDQESVEGAAVTLQVDASDRDGAPLTYTADNLPPDLEIDADSGVISGTITNTAATASPFEVIVTVTDGTFSIDTEFTWSVTNPPPAVLNPGDQVDVESPSTIDVELQIDATDPDGDLLTYTADNLPPGFSINNDNGLVTGTIGCASAGNFDVTVTVSDGVNTTSVNFTWQITEACVPGPI